MKFIATRNTDLNTVLDSKKVSEFDIVRSNLVTDSSCQIAEEYGKTIFFWGKIYNYNKLIDNYPKSTSIPMLILKRYEVNLLESFKELDGEFTFVISEEKKTLVYRDRHGAGPQVYYTKDNFTSHQKLLSYINNENFEPDFQTLALFLKIGYIPSPETALKNVWKIPGGQALIYENNTHRLQDLYGYKDFGLESETIKISEQEATLEFERLHKEALTSRVKDSSNVQLLLSGGYDSGGNIAGLRDVYQGKASSYSIGFDNNPWSELPLAKLMSDVYDTKHFEYNIDGSEIESLPEIVNHFGDPFNESGMMVNYTAMKLVSKEHGNGIILGGDGNDQHFGTAGRELALHYKYKKNGLQIVQKMVDAFSEMRLFEKDNKFFKIRFHNEKVLNILKSDAFGFRESQITKLFNTNVDIQNPRYLNDLPSKISSFDELYNVHNYFGDIKQVINEIILFKASKLADKFDNHLTFPYMSTDIYNFLKKLPRDVKLKGGLDACASGAGKSKFLHKNYLYPKLPKEITERKKQGGFAPLPIFFKDTKRFNKISEIIINSTLTQKHLNRAFVEQILNEYRTQKDNVGYWFWFKQVRAFQIFSLLTLVVWWETTIENREINTLSDI